MRDLVSLVRTLALVAFCAAIYQELRKPEEERTWHGKVAGVVPYDFRVPTLERLRAAYWDPGSDTIFTEHVWGVGWAVNLPVAMRKLSALLYQYAEASRRMSARVAEGKERGPSGPSGRGSR